MHVEEEQEEEDDEEEDEEAEEDEEDPEVEEVEEEVQDTEEDSEAGMPDRSVKNQCPQMSLSRKLARGFLEVYARGSGVTKVGSGVQQAV